MFAYKSIKMHISSDVENWTPCCTSCYNGFDILKYCMKLNLYYCFYKADNSVYEKEPEPVQRCPTKRLIHHIAT